MTDDSCKNGQTPAEVNAGLHALRHEQSQAVPQKNDADAIDGRLRQAKATQRAFIIRLYVTSLVVIILLSCAIYLTIRLS